MVMNPRHEVESEASGSTGELQTGASRFFLRSILAKGWDVIATSILKGLCTWFATYWDERKTNRLIPRKTSSHFRLRHYPFGMNVHFAKSLVLILRKKKKHLGDNELICINLLLLVFVLWYIIGLSSMRNLILDYLPVLSYKPTSYR